jgi:acyl carrier protein
MVLKLDFDEFCKTVLKILKDPWDGECDRDTRLFEDINLDSLEVFEFLIVVEALANLVVPLPEVPLIFTLGDAYDYYEIACVEAKSDKLR